MVKLGKYVFGKGKEELCPLCLEKIKSSVYHDCSLKGSVLIKRENYILVNISKDEPVVKRMLTLTNNKTDDSKKFTILYVNKILVGYKGTNTIKFIPGFSEEHFKNILKEYIPKSEREKNTFKNRWNINTHVHEKLNAIKHY